MEKNDEITIDVVVSKLNDSLMESKKEDNKKYEKIIVPDVQLFYLEYKNNFIPKILDINGRFWHYIENLTLRLDKRKFFGYFNKTLSMYPAFKQGNFDEAIDYFRRCQLLAILQMMSFINNSLPQFSNTPGLIKIGPSKNSKKNCCIIDDSTVIDEKNNNSIRETDGSEKEPHRGYKMFTDLSFNIRTDVITSLHNSFIQLENILRRIKSRQYMLFNPIEMIQRIVKYCEAHKMYNVINTLSWEIHDSPYNLSIIEQIELFKDYDNLLKLWNNNLITNNQGKFRIFILAIHYMDNIFRNNINEHFIDIKA